MTTSREKVRILVLHSSSEARQIFQKLLLFEEDFEIVGLVGTAEEAFQQASVLRPDVALVNYPLPDMNGLDVVVDLSRLAPEMSIILLFPEEGFSSSAPPFPKSVTAIFINPPAADTLLEEIRHARQFALSQRHTRIYGQARLSDVAEALRRTSNSTQEALETLKKKGLVTTVVGADGSDWVVVTRKGTDVLSRLETGLSVPEYNVLQVAHQPFGSAVGLDRWPSRDVSMSSAESFVGLDAERANSLRNTSGQNHTAFRGAIVVARKYVVDHLAWSAQHRGDESYGTAVTLAVRACCGFGGKYCCVFLKATTSKKLECTALADLIFEEDGWHVLSGILGPVSKQKRSRLSAQYVDWSTGGGVTPNGQGYIVVFGTVSNPSISEVAAIFQDGMRLFAPVLAGAFLATLWPAPSTGHRVVRWEGMDDSGAIVHTHAWP
jgi:DNA-binding NarL/FixJ family response regulator